jgi:hypothetical protein
MSKWLLLGLALASLTACTSVPPPGDDRESPRITLSLLNGVRSVSFSSTEGAANLGDRCMKARGFPGVPARVSVSFSDAGGLDHVLVKAFPGEIIDSSVVVGPSWTVEHAADRTIDTVTVRFPPPGEDGRVLSGALVVFHLTTEEPPVALTVEAFDLSGNVTYLRQVDILGPNDDRFCRGEE